jgi:tRNA (cmo5U34)-methyltransferase
MRDEVYSTPQRQIVDFAFTSEVAAVFPDMIRRSVPGYETVIPLTGLIAARHLGDGGTAYDLGCSLGATSQALLACTTAPNVEVIGIDKSAPMIDGANRANTDPRARFVEQDINDVDVAGAQVVILNFVLQFIDPGRRDALMQRLCAAMGDGGLLVLSEKVRNPDAALQAFYDTTHLAWKRANGYSDLEINQKRTALEKVMLVDTEEGHHKRLSAAGFARHQQWYRCMNWVSFLAYK